jgi:hypothetical protein
MQSSAGSLLPNHLRNSLLFGVLVALALVIAGRLLIPATSFISVAAASVILIAYGGLAATVFGGEMVLEYALLPANNSLFGLVEFGTVFVLYFASALVAALRSRSVKTAVLTAVASAFIASLLWAIFALVIFYAFRGSPRQALVLRAEGDYEDFARSGMSDFNAFIMEDFMGATFFHLLLGPLVAAVLGILGGLLGKAIWYLRQRGSQPEG